MIADPDVLAANLVEVVERRAGDGRTRHLGRREVRDRRQRPGPPHVRDDVLDEALDLLGRVLVGDRPARSATDHAETCLLIEAVDLDRPPSVSYGSSWRPSRHASVKAITPSMSSPAARFGFTGKPSVSSRSRAPDWVDTPTAADPHPRHLGRQPLFLDELVRPRGEQPAGGDLRVLLAERARATVAWVRAPRASSRSVLIRANSAFRHEDLAADIH